MTQTFTIAFIFSFLGSIPPGSINLSVIQLSIDNKLGTAVRFALAAALIEFPYAFVAVQFEGLLASSPIIINNFNLIAALVMIILGIVSLWPLKASSSGLIEKIRNSGFRKGILISLLNPLAIPFWIGITAYLNNQQLINLDSTNQIFVYIFGISTGTFSLLTIVALLGNKIRPFLIRNKAAKVLPGVTFLLLGLYALLQYLTLI